MDLKIKPFIEFKSQVMSSKTKGAHLYLDVSCLCCFLLKMVAGGSWRFDLVRFRGFLHQIKKKNPLNVLEITNLTPF